MDMLEIAMVITTLIKLATSGYLLRIYFRTRRRSSLIFSVALLVYSLVTLSDLIGNYFLNQISLALTSVFMFGAIYYFGIEEERLMGSKVVYVSISLTPIVVTLYTWLLQKTMVEFGIWGIVAINWGVSGFFILLSGLLALELRRTFKSDVFWLALPLMAIGAHEMDYPFLRPIQWFAPIGFLLAATFVVLLAYGIVKVFGSETYFHGRSVKRPTQINLSPGSIVMGSQEFNRIVQNLKDFPVLAFVRNIKPLDGWYSYFVTRAREDGNVLSPTNLPRMLELSKKYFQSVENGIVVIDCLEYFSIYNGFENTLKYLAMLRDYAVLHNGTLIIVTDRMLWNDKEWSLLMNMFSQPQS
ncbi:DUF835 domain-containing protein [Pyrococcus abyssi]|uniref:DUF835 domain-containing protein n=1 Tax=Pyrococcus abyssi (strain GE5 / Orsay) TaxID=272844 RepID=Q9UYH4_PYRAB|nr:DUF835 domain-containing protein [Pyrococcus abyssi]CAB50438.1 Hypothetical protein PAB1351 [Pyrococcus abyssi GE5]CCE70987.1 TPA: hypothetical protein PAB1351 [Pyrococcus abyssi GE5]